MQTMAVFFLVALAIGGVAWVFVYPMISGERQAERRKETVVRTGSMPTRVPRNAQRSRREQVEESLKELENVGRRKSVPLANEDCPGRPELVETAIHPHQRRDGTGGIRRVPADRRRDLCGPWRGLRGRLRHATVAAQVSQEPAGKQIPGGVPGCRRHHRPRHQGGTAAARQHADHHHRSERAAAR